MKMVHRLPKRKQSHPWNWLLLIALFFSVIPSATPAVLAKDDRLQPVLRELAISHPDKRIEVIVQVAGPTGPVADSIEALGGFVFHDLHIINALGATMPAQALLSLESTPGVQWISYNAPMTAAAENGESFTYTTWASETASARAIVDDLDVEAIPAGSTIWFSAVLKVDRTHIEPTVVVRPSTISFHVNGRRYALDVPGGRIEFKRRLSQATTRYDQEKQIWVTQVPTSYDNEETFLTAIPFPVSEAITGQITDVTWRIGVDATRSGLTLNWKWAAAVYQTDFPADYNDIWVKPVQNRETPSAHTKDVAAGTPEALTACHCLIGGTVHYSAEQELAPGFADGMGSDNGVMHRSSNNIIGHTGPDNYFGWGSIGKQGYAGFESTFTPGYILAKVEVVLRAYVPRPLTNDIDLELYLGDAAGSIHIPREMMNQAVLGKSGEIAVDVSNAFAWQWWQIDDMVLIIDHTRLSPVTPVFYDAVGLRITSLPGQPEKNVELPPIQAPREIETEALQEVFSAVVGATDVWNREGTRLQGQGITVAVVDSGVAKSNDFGTRKFNDVNFSRGYHDGNDKYGHGTFVAGILAGNGQTSNGAYVGIAPSANVLNVRVSDDQGMSTEADVVAALQWLLLNKDVYAIRVVNMSLNSSVAQSYHSSPLSIAAEILWFSGIVVVVSAGNNGTADLFPPANDPFVISVGATDDRGTLEKSDDIMADFSAHGVDEAGKVKPELVAPGSDIVALLPNNGKLTMGQDHPSNQVDMNHFRMSGTSIAAPVVAGAAVLLLQDQPYLTPDQVKQRLMSTADANWEGYSPATSGAGYVTIPAALADTSIATANDNVMPALPLAQMAMIAYWASADGAETLDWSSVNWSSVNWSSVNWSSVNWSSVNWSSVNWSSVNWSSVNWSSVNWSSVNWSSVNWSSVNWSSVNWSSVNWSSVHWNSTHWDAVADARSRTNPLEGAPASVPMLPEFHTIFIPQVQNSQ